MSCEAPLIIAAVAFPAVLFLLWIRRKYLKYCDEMERIDGLKWQCAQKKRWIAEILRNFDLFFGNGSRGTISFNVRTKAEFALSLVDGMALEDKVREYKRLYDMLYETWDRAERDPVNVSAIVSPLNTFCSEISQRRIDDIRKIMNEETEK